MEILTLDNDSAFCLTSKATHIANTKEGLKEAQKIADSLIETIVPLTPVAGLAAPQIGIGKRVFVYSWDRSIENFEIAINPTYAPVGTEKIQKWEVCLSTREDEGKYKASLLPRYKKIKATYTTLDGLTKTLLLQDFAARVFQHECDHLEGTVNIKRSDAEVKIFDTKEDFQAFIENIKKNDKVDYIKPKNFSL